MSPATNPFRSRYTEMQRDRSAFLRTFGVQVLEALPPAESAWNRLTVLRSAPGAGKTSILRLLTPESLTAVTSNAEDPSLRPLHAALQELGVIEAHQLKVLGVMVGVGKDYRSLIDLGPTGPGADKIFFKLLDVRIMTKAIEAALVAAGAQFPHEVHRLSFKKLPYSEGHRVRDAALQLFGVDADKTESLGAAGLLSTLREKEQSVMRLLSSLMPVRWDHVDGHAQLHSLAFLGNVEFFIDDAPLTSRPVLLFDDVHDLAPTQRDALWNQLLTREDGVGRWIAERRSAVPVEELFVGTNEGREYHLIELEDRITSNGSGGRSQRLQRVMNGVANSRAAAPLLSMGHTEQFTELLRRPDVLGEAEGERALAAAVGRVEELITQHESYARWASEVADRATNSQPIEAAIRWRELAILIERDVRKSSPTLFDFSDGDDVEASESTTKSDTRAAAKLFLFHEQKLPYYAGDAMLTELSSRNIEQYLSLAGDQFDLITSAITLRRREGPYLSPAEQDARIRNASRELWASIPRLVPAGGDVQSLLYAIALRCEAETYQPNAPYSPGVTGTALYWNESAALFRGAIRDEMSMRLRDAIGHAVASNLLESPRGAKAVKGQQFQVLYLNRLLLPAFNLPLQRGGFREDTVPGLKRRWGSAVRAPRQNVGNEFALQLTQSEEWFL